MSKCQIEEKMWQTFPEKISNSASICLLIMRSCVFSIHIFISYEIIDASTDSGNAIPLF